MVELTKLQYSNLKRYYRYYKKTQNELVSSEINEMFHNIFECLNSKELLAYGKSEDKFTYVPRLELFELIIQSHRSTTLQLVFTVITLIFAVISTVASILAIII